ncbi:MAG: hypothetical protein Roseis2KO_59560 [Roseivirga sp.]
MQLYKTRPFRHIVFWVVFWLLQSLLFSGGRHLDFYLAKNLAIVLLQVLLVYANLRLITKLLSKHKYLIYALCSATLIYFTYAISFEVIGLSFAIFFPGVTRMTVPGNTSWWPSDFWQVLSGSAPYSIALLGSTIYHLLRLERPVNDAPSSAEKDIAPDNTEEEYTLMLKEGKVIHRLDIRDILYVQGMKEYVSWHTADKRLVTLHSLSSLEALLGEKGFLRTHKSFIVNTRRVELIKYDSVEIPGKKIPIGRSYRTKVQNCFRSEI